MDIRFDDRVALVTGASTGIGAAVARDFGAAGAAVAVHYRRSEDAAARVVDDIRAAGGEAVALAADLATEDGPDVLVQAAYDAFGRIDVLVNNAGDLVSRRHTLTEMPDDVYDEIVSLNLTSVFKMCRAVVPAMIAAGRGSIVNMSSIVARTGGSGGILVYGTTKGGVTAFTKGLAKDLASHGIRVNAVAPGVIDTPLHARHTDPEHLRSMVADIPLGRLGTAEECSPAVLFLASDRASSFVTGQVIEVNGGEVMP